jgi:hypothetical protein
METSNKRLWTGRVLSGIPALFMLWDAAMKIVVNHYVTESMTRLGWPALEVQLGVTELACVLLYLVPRTRVLGAALLTAWLGGAVATHVRIGDPFWFPIVTGVFLWSGMLLRDAPLARVVVGSWSSPRSESRAVLE